MEKKREQMMKKTLMKAVAILILLPVVTGISSCSKGPKDWYNATLEYYTEGFSSGWANEEDDMSISDEMKDPGNTFGYLLTDLNGDGIDELLIGLVEESGFTKFTDIIIWHTDLGAYRVISCGNGDYCYLCNDNVIMQDSWPGTENTTDYMRFDNNVFTILDEGQYYPKHVELTVFGS